MVGVAVTMIDVAVIILVACVVSPCMCRWLGRNLVGRSM
jgi:hypothetical protein